MGWPLLDQILAPHREACVHVRSHTFSIGADQEAAMRADVQRLLEKGLIAAPSPEQWRMILCPQAVSRVLAGAGSGKSTALLLRLLLMLRHLQLPAQQISLFSFTRASAQDLRQRLQRWAEALQWSDIPTPADHPISTFHARLMGQRAATRLIDLESQHGVEGLALMRQVYLQLWRDQPKFRHQVQELLTTLNPAPAVTISAARARADAAYVLSHLERPAQPVPLPGSDLHAHARSDSCYLFMDSAFNREDPRTRARRWRFLREAPAHALWLDAHEVDAWRQGCWHAPRPGAAPLRWVLAPGESQGRPLFEHLGQHAQLLLMLGQTSPPSAQHAEHRQELLFLQVLRSFMRGLLSRMDQQGLCTYDRLFLERVERPDPRLTHILIDEAQDLSRPPLHWLCAHQRCLQAQGQSISVMAIGDDWQAIYGWRGATPEPLLDLRRHWCTPASAYADIVLTDNFRSTQPIVAASLCMLEGLHRRSRRPVRAQAGPAAADALLYAYHPGIHSLSIDDAAWPAILNLLKSIDQNATGILIMSARLCLLEALKLRLAPTQNYTLSSIHAAKGLEAEVTVLLGDIPRPRLQAWRHLLRHNDKTEPEHHQAQLRLQEDEALRLAYVGLSRARARSLWIGPPPQQVSPLVQRWLRLARIPQQELR